MKGPSDKRFTTRRLIDGSVTSQGSRIESGRRALEAATDRSQRSDSLVVGPYMGVGDRRVESGVPNRAQCPSQLSHSRAVRIVARVSARIDALAASAKFLIRKAWPHPKGIRNPLNAAGLIPANH